MSDIFDELFDRRRVSRLMLGADPSWVPQQYPVGPDFVQPQGFIQDGVVDVASFASTIAPVRLVAANPSLPDADYPTDTFIYNTVDQKLYKNIGGTWEYVVGAGDIDSITQFASTIRPPVVVGALPTLPDSSYPAGSLAYLSTTNILYKTEDASTWTAVVDAADMAGQIVETQITDSAITTPKINALAVTTAKIAAGAVTANEIAANTITAGEIAAGAIATDELAAGAVTTDKITAGAITTTELAALAVTTAKIAAGAVSTSELAAGAVTAEKIAANAVTANKIQVGSFAWNGAGNLLRDGAFDWLGLGNTTYWTLGSGWASSSSTKTSTYGVGRSRVRVAAPSGLTSNLTSTTAVKMAKNQVYNVSILHVLESWTAGSMKLVLKQYNSSDVLLTTSTLETFGATIPVQANAYIVAGFSATLPTGVTADLTLDTDCVYVIFELQATSLSCTNYYVLSAAITHGPVASFGGNPAAYEGGVSIDAAGIIIYNGAFILTDEYGYTVATASGFTGGWAEQVALGLLNAVFANGATGALNTGRTSDLPFWTYSKVTGTPTLTRTADTNYPGGYRCRAEFTANGDKIRLVSDAVAVTGGAPYQMVFSYGYNVVTATAITIGQGVEWFDAAGSSLGSPTMWEVGKAGVASSTTARTTASETAPYKAKTAKVYLEITQDTGHSTSNWFDFALAGLNLVPSELDDAGTYSVYSMSGDVVYGAYLQGDRFVHGDTTMPTGVAAGAIHYRSDHKMWFQYDGTRWVCACPHVGNMIMHVQTTQPISASASNRWLYPFPTPLNLDVWVEDAFLSWYVASGGTALDASNNWVGTIRNRDTGTSRATLTIDSGAADTWFTTSTAVDVAEDITSSQVAYELSWVKTGTPGTLRFVAGIVYRFIAT